MRAPFQTEPRARALRGRQFWYSTPLHPITTAQVRWYCRGAQTELAQATLEVVSREALPAMAAVAVPTETRPPTIKTQAVAVAEAMAMAALAATVGRQVLRRDRKPAASVAVGYPRLQRACLWAVAAVRARITMEPARLQMAWPVRALEGAVWSSFVRVASAERRRLVLRAPVQTIQF